MTLLAFDYQGVFHTPDGTYQQDVFDFIRQPHEHVRFAIVSNLPRTSLMQELSNHQVPLRDIDIYGYEDMDNKAAAIHELNHIWQPKQSIFVTDTVRDIKDVKRSNATILAVTWGYSSEAHLQEAGPHAMLCSAKKLIDYLNAHL